MTTLSASPPSRPMLLFELLSLTVAAGCTSFVSIEPSAAGVLEVHLYPADGETITLRGVEYRVDEGSDGAPVFEMAVEAGQKVALDFANHSTGRKAAKRKHVFYYTRVRPTSPTAASDPEPPKQKKKSRGIFHKIAKLATVRKKKKAPEQEPLKEAEAKTKAEAAAKAVAEAQAAAAAKAAAAEAKAFEKVVSDTVRGETRASMKAMRSVLRWSALALLAALALALARLVLSRHRQGDGGGRGRRRGGRWRGGGGGRNRGRGVGGCGGSGSLQQRSNRPRADSWNGGRELRNRPALLKKRATGGFRGRTAPPKRR